MQNYLYLCVANQVIPAAYLAPFVTYSVLNDEITFTIHYFYPNIREISETFKYVLNGNSLIIKGFSNPFSGTFEGRSDVHFTKISEQAHCDQDVVISNTEYETAPNFPVFIEDMHIEGHCLKIRFTSSACDGHTWVVKLIDCGDLTGYTCLDCPIQRTLRLSLDNQEVCA